MITFDLLIRNNRILLEKFQAGDEGGWGCARTMMGMTVIDYSFFFCVSS
jgi:hypothetical protein